MPEQVRAPRASDALTSNQLLEMYWFARLAREIEERLVILFRQSKVIGGLYRSLGQEGESVGTAYALKKTDAVLPLIRNMGALMTMGVRPKEIFLQVHGEGGVEFTGPRSQHPHRPSARMDPQAGPEWAGPSGPA